MAWVEVHLYLLEVVVQGQEQSQNLRLKVGVALLPMEAFPIRWKVWHCCSNQKILFLRGEVVVVDHP